MVNGKIDLILCDQNEHLLQQKLDAVDNNGSFKKEHIGQNKEFLMVGNSDEFDLDFSKQLFKWQIKYFWYSKAVDAKDTF